MIKKLYYKLIGMHPGKMPMVSYWRTKDHVEAKLTTKDGATLMVMEGEKHPMWGFPRGHLLIPTKNIKEATTLEERINKFGPFSVLKHESKQIFNEIWRKLEEGVSQETIIKETLESLDKLPIEHLKYDLMPSKTMCPAVREIYRAWTKVAPSPLSLKLRDIVTLILQEDDGYRYRCQDLAEYFNPNVWWKRVLRFLLGKSYFEGVKWEIEKGLEMVEHSETIGDMKERIRLLRKGITLILKDPKISLLFEGLCKEVDWKKVYLQEMDKYHFRAKYYRVDRRVLEY